MTYFTTFVQVTLNIAMVLKMDCDYRSVVNILRCSLLILVCGIFTVKGFSNGAPTDFCQYKTTNGMPNHRNFEMKPRHAVSDHLAFPSEIPHNYKINVGPPLDKYGRRKGKENVYYKMNFQNICFIL